MVHPLEGKRDRVITPTGQVTQYPHPGDPTNARSNGIARGVDGNMWFCGGNSGPGGTQVMGRMTPTGAVKPFGTVASSHPFGVALGSDGHIWFTNYQGKSTIGRMYTSAHQLPVNCGALPKSIDTRGETVLLAEDCRTNAGNLLRINVPSANSDRADSNLYVIKRDPRGKFSIKTFDTGPIKPLITACA